MPFISELETATIWNIIFLVLAVVGIMWGLYSHFSSKPKRIPYYHINHFNVITPSLQNKLSSFEIYSNGRPVETLSVTKILVWNDGNTPIRKEDIPVNTPFKITFGSHMFEAKVVAKSSNKFNVDLDYEDEKNIILEFDFLDKKEGFIIEVTHSEIDEKNIILEGNVIGGNNISSYIPKPILSEKGRRKGQAIFGLMLLSLLFFILFSDYGEIGLIILFFFMCVVVWAANWRSEIPTKFKKMMHEK